MYHLFYHILNVSRISITVYTIILPYVRFIYHINQYLHLSFLPYIKYIHTIYHDYYTIYVMYLVPYNIHLIPYVPFIVPYIKYIMYQYYGILNNTTIWQFYLEYNSIFTSNIATTYHILIPYIIYSHHIYIDYYTI